MTGGSPPSTYRGSESREVGEGSIACHYAAPVSQLQPGQTTKVSELALHCVNGHRMKHRSREVVTVQELAEAMAQVR